MIIMGLMSGTSADGTDVSIVSLEGEPPHLQWELRHFTAVPHPPGLRTEILAAMRPETSSVDQLCRLNIALAEQFSQAALTALAEANLSTSDLTCIGSHGQTVWHEPDGLYPGTLQLGEAAVIAERVGVPVINNFRARDMAAGGQGAPLAPYLDYLLLSDDKQYRAAQNIGGIGNVTFLPPPGSSEDVIAFDTGPGNVLLDDAANRITNGEWQYDKDGVLANQGQVNQTLLAQLLAQPYLHLPPPKSTGRELYSQAYADDLWAQAQQAQIKPHDIIATLTAFTAHSIAQAYQQFLPQMPARVIVSGGGTQNPVLMRHLADLLQPATVGPIDDMGIPSDAKEGLAFAVMAYETWHKRPGNLPAATGANRPVILGQICW